MRSSTRSGSTVQLALDSLESRLTPAGILNVFNSNGILNIVSDASSHSFTVYVHDDRLVVSTHDTTIINGIAGNRSATIMGGQDLITGLVINGNRSTDNVGIADRLTNARNLDITVQTADGNDTVAFSSLDGVGKIAGNVNIDTGRRDDQVNLNGNWNGLNLGVDLGDGNDVLRVLGSIGNISSLNGNTGKSDVLEIVDAVYQVYRTRITGFEIITRT